MHIHVSPIEALTTLGYLIIIGFFWRTLAARWSDNKLGQAMAYIY